MSRVALELLDNHYSPDPRVFMTRTMLARLGLGSDVLAWDKRELASDTDQRDDFGTVVRVAVTSGHGEGWRKLRKLMLVYVRFFTRFRRRHRAARYDLIIVNDIFLLPLGWICAVRGRVPLIYDAHEEFAAMEGGRHPKLVLRLVEAIETRLARRAALILVPGESRQTRWREVGREALVIRNLGQTLAAERPARDEGIPEFDLVYCGTLTEARRLDLLVELATQRPDLRIGVAGAGRTAASMTEAAQDHPNFAFVGWTDDPIAFLRRGAAVYYGLDPTHPYASKACPNNLYQALYADRPLIFHCGGEPQALLARHRFGIRCAADASEIAAAVDAVPLLEWSSVEAWQELRAEALLGEQAFLESVSDLLGR